MDYGTDMNSGMSVTGDPAGDPVKSGLPLADIVAGKDAAIAILGALIGDGTGRSAVARAIAVEIGCASTLAAVPSRWSAFGRALFECLPPIAFEIPRPIQVAPRPTCGGPAANADIDSAWSRSDLVPRRSCDAMTRLQPREQSLRGLGPARRRG